MSTYKIYEGPIFCVCLHGLFFIAHDNDIKQIRYFSVIPHGFFKICVVQGNGYGPPQARGDYSMMYDDPYRRAPVDYMRQMADRFPPGDSFRDSMCMSSYLSEHYQQSVY